MDKFFSNLGKGGGDKKKKSDSNNNKPQRGKDESNNSWQGGRSGGMDSIKKKSANPVSRIAAGGGGGGNRTTDNGGNTANNNIFEKAGAGINEFFNKQNKAANNRGGGQSLGGTKPGRVLSVSLGNGPLGMEVEKRKTSQATAIILGIIPNGQADKAGLKRGDIVCHPGSNGNEEIRYDQFVAMAKSGRRPLRFDVRRIESSILSGVDGKTGGGRVSADYIARKQAVVAAAEARDAKHKAKQKPIPRSEKRMMDQKPEKIYDHHQAEVSDETRRAMAAVKQAEREDAVNLGYNPYEAKAMTSGQARTATVAMTQGEISAGNAPPQMAANVSPGRVNKPKDPVKTGKPPPPEFEHAFSTLVTSNYDHAAVLKSLSIMRKLINNATTKGQQGNDETSSKFRRVRLTNPKIKEAIADVNGALELMMCTGFVLSESDADGETYLVFPPGEKGSSWLSSALAMMESYENDSGNEIKSSRV